MKSSSFSTQVNRCHRLIEISRFLWGLLLSGSLLMVLSSPGMSQGSFDPQGDNNGAPAFDPGFDPEPTPPVADPSGNGMGATPQIPPAFDPNLGMYNPQATFPEAINEQMAGWMNFAEWDRSVELGINGGTGNSESFNVTGGFDLKRDTAFSEMRITTKYINNKSNDVLVANNARLNLDWERKFTDGTASGANNSRWSWFVKNNYFYDEFRPFDLRIALNTGLGYKIINTDIQMLKGRFGVGFSRELGGINDDWIPEALFGLDYRRQLSKRQKLEATVDYFPSWENFSDYRVVSDLSWSFLIDEPNNLSLKLNINDQYDSTPDGAKANDLFYSLLLLWKF